MHQQRRIPISLFQTRQLRPDGVAVHEPTSEPLIARDAIVEDSKGMDPAIAVLIVILVVGCCLLAVVALWRYKKTKQNGDLEALSPQTGNNNTLKQSDSVID